MTRLEVESGRSIYYEHHHGTGRPIVLVHPWGMTGRMWDRAVSELKADGHEIVVLDHRGCGRSDKDFDDYSVATLGADVAKLVDHLGLVEPVLNGWSIGGPIVVAAAALLGDNLGGLVSTVGATPRFSATPDFPEGTPIENAEGIIAGLATARVDTTRGVAEAVCHAPQSEAVIAWMHDQFLQTSPRADESLADLARNVDQRDLLPTITAPALLFGGRHDVFVPHAVVQRAAELLPRGRFVSCEESGHAPPLEEPELYFGELRTFLKALG